MYIALGQTTTGTLPSGSGSATTTTTGGASSLPGTGSGIAPSSGGAPISLMSNWTYHPAVVMGMQLNPTVFRNPQGDYVNWRMLADSILVAVGAVDPNNPSGYQDAVWALSSAYGYYFMPGSTRFEVTVQQGAAAAAQEFLTNDAYAMTVYATYAATQAQAAGLSPGVKPRTTGIRQHVSNVPRPPPPPGTPGALPPGAVPPGTAPPSSSTPWLLLGGVAVVGAAAYFLI